MAAHLLGGDVSILSRHRDRYLFSGDPFRHWNSLVELINHLNAEWVAATGRLSPRLLVDMLRFTGEQTTTFFQTIDPYELGGPVSWAGNETGAQLAGPGPRIHGTLAPSTADPGCSR